jgi:tetratricopeptide (TPR) repeat protein
MDLARHAVGLSRSAGDRWNLALSLMVLTMCKDAPDDELNATTHDIELLLRANPQWSLLARLAVLRSLAWACVLRDDHSAALELRLKLLELTEQDGEVRILGLAITDVCESLRLVGRHSEALERLRAVRDIPGGRSSFHMVLVTTVIMRILFDMGRFDEALAEWPNLTDRARSIGVLAPRETAALGAAQMKHPRAAALLIGHVRQAYAARDQREDTTRGSDIARATALASESLDAGTFEELVRRGRDLDEAAADQLLLSTEDATRQ